MAYLYEIVRRIVVQVFHQSHLIQIINVRRSQLIENHNNVQSLQGATTQAQPSNNHNDSFSF